MGSVTRLGEISPFWAIFTRAWAILTQLNSLKTWFVILILTFKSSLMQLIWTFKLSFDILATVLATLPNIGQFFQSPGHSVYVRRDDTGTMMLNTDRGPVS
jgi:hypothetical protein